MIFKYQIMSYIPFLNISSRQAQHDWTSHKISNFLNNKLSMERTIINKIISSQENLHIKNEMFYTDNDTSLYLEYTSKPLQQFFKIKSFIVIYK